MKDIISRVSEDLGIPKEVVKEVYSSFWKYIKETIQELPLKEDLTKEDFEKLRTNFNIPSLGKFYCDYTRYINTKKRFEYIKNLRNDNNNKEGEAIV